MGEDLHTDPFVFPSKDLTVPSPLSMCFISHSLITCENVNSLFALFVLKVFIFTSVCLHVCICTTCRLGACRGQNMALDHLELEAETVMRHRVGLGTGQHQRS